MSAASNTANSFATVNLVLQILLGASLKLLWAMINTLQFVVFFEEWPVLIPMNAKFAMDFFRTVALGEFIPYEEVTGPLSEPFQSEEGENILSSMGVMLVFGGIVLILAVLVVIMFRCCRPGMKCHSIGQKLKAKIFWNSMLRFSLQSSLKNSLAVMFTIKAISFSTTADTLNGVTGLVLLTILVGLPVFYAILLHKNRKEL